MVNLTHCLRSYLHESVFIVVVIINIIIIIIIYTTVAVDRCLAVLTIMFVSPAKAIPCFTLCRNKGLAGDDWKKT